MIYFRLYFIFNNWIILCSLYDGSGAASLLWTSSTWKIYANNASFPSRSFYTERQLMWKSMLWTPYVACNILPLSSYTFTASYAIWGRCWMQDYGWNCKWLHHRWCLHIFLIIKSACAWKSGIDVSSDQPESFTLYIFVTRSHQLTGNTEKSLNSKNNEKWKSYHFLIKSTVTLGRRTRHKHLAVQIRLDRKGYS